MCSCTRTVVSQIKQWVYVDYSYDDSHSLSQTSSLPNQTPIHVTFSLVPTFIRLGPSERA
eukprot:COSAG01_NODE_1507_length_10090_cov_4.104694_13_plen_60_part_00